MVSENPNKNLCVNCIFGKLLVLAGSGQVLEEDSTVLWHLYL